MKQLEKTSGLWDGKGYFEQDMKKNKEIKNKNGQVKLY